MKVGGGEPKDRPAVRIALIDDHPVVRMGLRLVLEDVPEVEVVAEAAGLDEALALTVKADVVVADLVLQDTSGASVVAALRHKLPSAAVLVLSMVDDPNEVSRALAAGAAGYLLKGAGPADLVEAIRRVAAGETYLQPSLGAKLARSRPSPSDPDITKVRLTAKEQDVLRLLALGHTNVEIAALLSVSLRTAEGRRAQLLRKLGLQTRAELVRFASDTGLVEFGPH